MRFRGLSTIVCGLLFLFLNINISGFDVVPDFVGYCLILVGLSSLKAEHSAFGKAVPPAILLLVHSLWQMWEAFMAGKSSTDFMIPDMMAETATFSGSLWLNWLIGLIACWCSIVLRLSIGRGMTDLLRDRELFSEASKTSTCVVWNAVVIIAVALLTFPPILPMMQVLGIPLTVVGLIVGIWLMIRIQYNRRLLEADYN